MEIISQTIKYTREELNRILKKLKGNVDLIFCVEKLTKNEQKLIEYYHKTADVNYFTFEDEFSEIIKKFKSKIIYGGKSRLVIYSKDAFVLINELINSLKLYDFWIINENRIICLDHESEICVINKRNLR